MNLSDYQFTTRINTYLSARMKLDKELTMVEFDQSCREFFGEYMNLPFYECGRTPEMKQELREFFSFIAENGSGRVAVVVSDRRDLPHFVDICGTYNGEKEACYELVVVDVPDMEDDFVHYRDNMWKYRAMLGMSELIFFDYDMSNNIASCYRYIGIKSVRLFYGDIDGFEAAVREYAEQTDSNIFQIDKFIANLRAGKNTFESTFKSGFLHIDHKIQQLNIKSRFDDMNGHKNVYSVINNLNETDEDIPFYMTSAGMDSATGLLNKRSLIDYSEDILTNPATASRNHYMVLIDIDNFKGINDNLGHQMGDKVIQMLATTLFDVIGDAGIIGRYGGDEFYILTDMIENENVLRTMVRNIRGTLELRAREMLGIEKLTLSMGVSSYPENGKTFNDLLKLADKALYIAKEKGKDRYVIYRSDIHDQISTGSEGQGISTYAEQAKAFNSFTLEVFAKGKEAIEENLDAILKSFDLDGIEIFAGPDFKKIYSIGKYSLSGGAEAFLNTEKYLSRFDATGVYSLNNYNGLKRGLPDLFDYLDRERCFSYVQVALPADKPEYFANFYVLNRNHQWNEAEKSALSLCGSLVYYALNK